MRILFLTPQIPYPPHQGAAIRNFHLISHLARRHTVDLITFDKGPGEAATDPTANPLTTLCRRLVVLPHPQRTLAARLQALVTSLWPDMALRLEDPAFHRQVAAWITDGAYDIVQIEGIELAQYARHAEAAAIPVVFDNHNCEYLLQRRSALTDLRTLRRLHAAAYSLVQWAKLRRYEAYVCRRATAVVAVSRPDAAALQAIAATARISVVPNAIDLADYPPAPSPTDQPADYPFRLLFTGKMDYRPNIDAVLWFGEEVWPLLQPHYPALKWQIVGMNPSPRLDYLRDRPGIEITGSVPDIRPYLRQADVYVIPMRVGGGTRFKALEAMASAKAIVSTSLGVEGIAVQAERELLLADRPDDFAAALRTLIEDRATGAQLAAALGRRARDFVAAHYTWQRIIPALEALYASLHTPALPDSKQPSNA